MNQPEVTIKQGTLRGSVGLDLRGESFLKFQGIPYAKPPIGDLRFKAPVPPEKWTGIFDATKEGDNCYARDLYRPFISGSENCLVLNVYTKSVKEKDLRPVLFWIHGGGFSLGSGSEEFYGPNFLLTEDVLLVSINYRLGILGFLTLADPELGVPGNAGLKDQVMALKWVQKNISKFGGDPDNVTIFGESAGAASVHLLMLSPMAKGLFHKAIPQSGCALNPWVLGDQNGKKLAAALNLKDEKTLLDTLMGKTVEELLEAQDKCADKVVANERKCFGVVVENGSHEPAFLPDYPIKLIQTGQFAQVPLMIGFTSVEGMVFELFKNPNRKDLTFEDHIPWFFGYQLGSPESKAVADKIKKFYYGDEEPSQENIIKKFDIQTDCMLVYGICDVVLKQFPISKAPTYLYQMSIETGLNFVKKIVNIEVPGVCHCDDVGYLFNHFATPEIEPGSVEDVAVRKFVKLWTNFARSGNPTPDHNDSLLKVVWKPVTSGSLEFLDIGDDLVLRSNPLAERMNFWKELFASSPTGQKARLNLK